MIPSPVFDPSVLNPYFDRLVQITQRSGERYDAYSELKVDALSIRTVVDHRSTVLRIYRGPVCVIITCIGKDIYSHEVSVQTNGENGVDVTGEEGPWNTALATLVEVIDEGFVQSANGKWYVAKEREADLAMARTLNFDSASAEYQQEEAQDLAEDIFEELADLDQGSSNSPYHFRLRGSS